MMFENGSYTDDHVKAEVKDLHEVDDSERPERTYERRMTYLDQAA